jgi:hypothetical protein
MTRGKGFQTSSVVFAVVVLLCQRAATATGAPAEQAAGSVAVQPLQFVGVAEDAVKDPEYHIALNSMHLVKDAGFNSVRITVKWWKDMTKLSDYDRGGVCNAARAAEALGIKLVVTTIGDAGNPPFKLDQFLTFNAFQRDLVDVLLGRNDVLRAQGAVCAPNVKDLRLEIWNEPNLATFLLPQRSEDGGRESARIYTAMLASAYRALKAHAAALGVRVEVWGGALGSSQDPVNFIRAMGRARRDFRIRGRLMDVFTYHPYETNADVPPGAGRGRGFGSHATIAREVRAHVCGRCPIVYSEIGWETAAPPGKAWLYEGEDASTLRPISERKLAQFYASGFSLARVQGVRGMFIFPLFDQRNRPIGWQSGLYYPTYTGDFWPKATLGLLRPFLKELTAGAAR